MMQSLKDVTRKLNEKLKTRCNMTMFKNKAHYDRTETESYITLSTFRYSLSEYVLFLLKKIILKRSL